LKLGRTGQKGAETGAVVLKVGDEPRGTRGQGSVTGDTSGGGY